MKAFEVGLVTHTIGSLRGPLYSEDPVRSPDTLSSHHKDCRTSIRVKVQACLLS